MIFNKAIVAAIEQAFKAASKIKDKKRTTRVKE